MQLEVGNFLLQATWVLMAALTKVGGCGICEHPVEPDWQPLCASSWYLNIVAAMCFMPAAQCFAFDQCVVGQLARAPTRLFTLRLPQVRTEITSCGSRGRCNHPAGFHKTLLGKASDGSFLSAAKKVYPLLLFLVSCRLRWPWSPMPPFWTLVSSQSCPNVFRAGIATLRPAYLSLPISMSPAWLGSASHFAVLFGGCCSLLSPHCFAWCSSLRLSVPALCPRLIEAG